GAALGTGGRYDDRVGVRRWCGIGLHEQLRVTPWDLDENGDARAAVQRKRLLGLRVRQAKRARLPARRRGFEDELHHAGPFVGDVERADARGRVEGVAD